MIQLVRPTEAMKEQAIEFRQEFLFFAVDDDRIVGIIELQTNNERNIDVKTKIDYYSRLSVCGENDSDTETFYFL